MTSTTLPPQIPIFPLPNVVLFPNVFLPLHIFEPRYRDMVGDALSGDRIIGMVLLKEGWERHADPNPPVYPIGCAGLITHVESLPDGQYNVVLRGFERFQVTGEDQARAYRRADVDAVPEQVSAEARTALHDSRQRLERLLDQRLDCAGSESKIPRDMPDDDLVNALSQYLEFEPVEKQALLERLGPCERCKALVELLEMRLMLADTPVPQCGVQ